MANIPTTVGEPREVLALRELVVCWDQAYSALNQGDVDRVSGLMELADEHLAVVRSGGRLPEALLHEAVAARARLEHGMKVGLEGLGVEVARARRGSKALRGYAAARRS